MEAAVIKEKDITPKLDAGLRTILIESYPHNAEQFKAGRRWRGNIPFYNVILYDNDEICGQISVIDRTIKVNSQPIRSAGIANVCIRPRYRGNNLSEMMLIASMDYAAKMDFDIGMLFTHSPIDKVYTRNHWQYISKRNYKRVENGISAGLPETSIVMYYTLKMKSLPDGDIDLNGDKW